MSPLVYVLAFLAALLTLEGVVLLVGSSRPARADRVRRRLRLLAPSLRGSRSDSESGDSALRNPRGTGSIGRVLAALPQGDAVDRLLYRAGMPITTVRLLLLTGMLAGLGFLALSLVLGDSVRGSLGLGFGAVPWLAIRRMARRRMRLFQDQLPEGLELLTRALRAGHGLAAGFQLVGRELDDPIGTEFALVSEEVRFGLDLRDALQNLVRRIDNPDLPYFTTAVLIQRQTGGNLAELLGKLSVLLRERSQFHGKVQALTAQGRGAATFLALWLPFIAGVLWVVTPDYLAPLFENTWGHAVLAVVLGLDVAGYLVARRIADVEA